MNPYLLKKVKIREIKQKRKAGSLSFLNLALSQVPQYKSLFRNLMLKRKLRMKYLLIFLRSWQ